MAFRFQRRIKIAPGIRLNVSKGGVGLSAGPRGASVSVGRRGVYGNVGIPGSGLSFREKLNKGPKGNTKRGKAAQGGHSNLLYRGNSVSSDGRSEIIGKTSAGLGSFDATLARHGQSNRLGFGPSCCYCTCSAR